MADNKNSQYDSSLIVKEVHDFHGQFIRTGDAKSVVPSYFSHFRATYDIQERPTLVTYFRGSLEHITQVGVTSATGLGGKYFLIRNNPSNSLFAVWYNLDGLSSAPVVSGATLIEVPVMSGDTAELVAMATMLVINATQSDNFKATRYGQTVTIATVGMGVITNSVDFNTGFLITNAAGTQEEVAEIAISYVGNDPLYNGQVLKGYRYNIFTGKFELKNELDLSGVEIDVGRGQVPLVQNITLSLNTVEYAVTFPVGTKKIYVKIRGYESSMQLSWTAGASTTEFISVSRGTSYLEEDINLQLGNNILYVTAQKPNMVLECLSWV